MVHEVPDPEGFFRDIFATLEPGARLLVIEPKGHVKPDEFAASMKRAEQVGFTLLPPPDGIRGPSQLLSKPS